MSECCEAAAARQRNCSDLRPEKWLSWHRPATHRPPLAFPSCKNPEALSTFILETIKKFPEDKWHGTFFSRESTSYLLRQMLIGLPTITAFSIHQSILEWGLVLSLMCLYLLAPLTIIELYTLKWVNFIIYMKLRKILLDLMLNQWVYK